MKGIMFLCLTAAIRTANARCEAFGDGMAVRVDADTVYEPDAMVRCGAPLDDNVTEVTDPMVVVEVVFPIAHKCDSGSKLDDYFRIPSVRHYLIVKTQNKAIIHHRRDDAGGITTHIIRGGALQLDPPGLTVTGLFGQ
jgi:Uma2 family endonuclease